MRCSNCTRKSAVRTLLTLCALTLALHGCGVLAEPTSVLPPAPKTPGAIIRNDYICIPSDEAVELLLWIERAEEGAR